MKKKLFQNYEYEFDKNEKKVLISFSKQAAKQMESDDRYIREAKIFNSILKKLDETQDKVKFTKEEKTKLTFQLSENLKYLQKKVDNSWFLKKWFFRNMLNQYKNILSIFSN
jgi:hypothetical protein